MKSSHASEQSGEIGLFPFLAVLLCTMGALLVLLVVLAEQAKRSAASSKDDALERPVVSSAAGASDDVEAKALATRLEQIRDRRGELDVLRREADERLRDEQSRLSHVEDHARRIEHELARLHLAYQQLQAAEQDQVVDQQQAKRELKRLTQLMQDAQQRIDEQRREAKTRKSYAIVPYKGKHGTERRPIYVECTSEGVVIQPEGVLLTEQDFAGPRRPGNPLASAMRAAREYINNRRDPQDSQTPPDPYPLLIVRPGGGDYYNAALRAIRDWDADFGYEFVDDETQLEFSALDPRLGQSMYHAVEQARQRQRVLAEIAPNRYGSLVGQFNPSPAGKGGSAGAGTIFGRNSDRYGGTVVGGGGAPQESGGSISTADNDANFLASDNAGAASGRSGQPGQSGGGSGNADVGAVHGGPEGDLEASSSELSDANGGAGTFSSTPEGSQHQDGAGGQTGATGDRYASSPDGQNSNVAGGGSQRSAANDSGETGSHVNPMGMSSGGGQAQGGASGQYGAPAHVASAPRGIDWAEKIDNQNAVAVRRPVRIGVYADRIALLSSRHGSEEPRPTGAVIMLDQPEHAVVQQLGAALQQHVQQWGLAGQGLFWRPELVLDASDGGATNAKKLARLLENSGVNVRPLESAAHPVEGETNGTR